MTRGRAIISVLAVCAIAALAPATAAARTAYFTGSEESGYAAPIELGTGALGAQVSIGTEGAPFDVAITPDGSTAYVTGYRELVAIDVATSAEGASIPMGAEEPIAVAISPDGTHAYTANGFEGTISIVDLATRTEVGGPIAVGGNLGGIAVTPDGARAYVTDQSGDRVVVVDLATATVIGSIPVGEEPEGIAVTPDGSSVFVANRSSKTVSRIDTATNTVTATISPVPAEQIAISPDGSHAYAVGVVPGSAPTESTVTPIDVATATAGTTGPVLGRGADIAILPDGSRAYVTEQEEQVSVPQLRPLDLATNAFGVGLPTYERPNALAIVPNQPPHAAISGPTSAQAGGGVSLDGSGSTDPDGTVARYDWEFGDGTGAANGGASVHHAYANPGTYVVTLTTTDNEGCSTALVFTGQTASCNGSNVARTTHTVTVAAEPAVPPQCPAVKGSATSFKPRIRPGHVVPGVRVRLAVGTPSRLTVKAKLLWSHKGKGHRTNLRKLSVNVNRWRRVRFAIPARLRKLLPLGRRVRVQLTIQATPLGDSGCAATTTRETLHVRVVKVFPNAVQHQRPR